MKLPQTVEFSALADNSVSFDEIIDVRSPAEFAKDHLPGAVNYPVLSNEERARVGTLNAQESAFAANQLGATLISTNIGALLGNELAGRPREWRVLVYCWRGGTRSGSLATVLASIGYRVRVLSGGYRAYRRWVLDELDRQSARLQFAVVAGRTGTGKSRILAALAARGAQVLDLETLACHRGSVLGLMPSTTQPTQKAFESDLVQNMRGFATDRPVYVESESRKIGQVQVPGSLITAMRASPCFMIEMSVDARARFLAQDYPHFITHPGRLLARLDRLAERHSKTTMAQWRADIDAGNWHAFVTDILGAHYDPSYDKSMQRNYQRLDSAVTVTLDDTNPDFGNAAEKILAAG